MKRFSKKWTYNVLRESVATLMASDIDDSIKKHTNAPFFITVNPYLTTTAAQVYVIPKPNKWARCIPDDKKDWVNIINGKPSYLLMELSAHHIYWDTPKNVKNTIIHEYSHILDFLENGFAGRTDNELHDDAWKEIHFALGYPPSQYYNVPTRLRMTDAYHDMAEKFDREVA